MYYLIALVVLAAILTPAFIAFRDMKNGKNPVRAKRAMVTNLAAFAIVFLVGLVLPLGGFVSAASAGELSLGAGLAYLGAGLAVGAAGIGAGLAVGHGSAAAIGAITENPKVFGQAMIFVVLGEGIAIYGLIISFMIIMAL